MQHLLFIYNSFFNPHIDGLSGGGGLALYLTPTLLFSRVFCSSEDPLSGKFMFLRQRHEGLSNNPLVSPVGNNTECSIRLSTCFGCAFEHNTRWSHRDTGPMSGRRQTINAVVAVNVHQRAPRHRQSSDTIGGRYWLSGRPMRIVQ